MKVGTDGVLLGAWVALGAADRLLLDVGTGTGVIALMLAQRSPAAGVTALDIDAACAEQARANADRSPWGGRVTTCCAPVQEYRPEEPFDLVVSNPPYFPAGSGESGGSARMELCCTLTQVCAAAAFLLKNGGRFALVHRPERLAGLMEALGQSGLEPKRLQMVQHDRDKPPSAVLVEAVRQGRPGLSVLPTLILNER